MWLSTFYRVTCLMCKKKLLIAVLNFIRATLIFKLGKRRLFSHGMLITSTMTDTSNMGVKNLHVTAGGTS